MKKTMRIELSGHATAFHLDEAAAAMLQTYLDRARARLHADPDREEVLRDLEQAIGDKLLALQGTDGQVLDAPRVEPVLQQVGAVDGEASAEAPAERRLCRIRQGQWIAGVCQGLAAHSEIGVDWVRTIFIILSVFTGGMMLVAYAIMAFTLPVCRPQAAGS